MLIDQICFQVGLIMNFEVFRSSFIVTGFPLSVLFLLYHRNVGKLTSKELHLVFFTHLLLPVTVTMKCLALSSLVIHTRRYHATVLMIQTADKNVQSCRWWFIFMNSCANSPRNSTQHRSLRPRRLATTRLWAS